MRRRRRRQHCQHTHGATTRATHGAVVEGGTAPAPRHRDRERDAQARELLSEAADGVNELAELTSEMMDVDLDEPGWGAWAWGGLVLGTGGLVALGVLTGSAGWPLAIVAVLVAAGCVIHSLADEA